MSSVLSNTDMLSNVILFYFIFSNFIVFYLCLRRCMCVSVCVCALGLMCFVHVQYPSLPVVYGALIILLRLCTCVCVVPSLSLPSYVCVGG